MPINPADDPMIDDPGQTNAVEFCWFVDRFWISFRFLEDTFYLHEIRYSFEGVSLPR